MKIIVINEDNHGFIGLAKDYPNALNFLNNEGWMDDNTEVWENPDTYEYGKLKDVLGEDWFDSMMTWGIERFNDYWDGSFYLEEREVYGL